MADLAAKQYYIEFVTDISGSTVMPSVPKWIPDRVLSKKSPSKLTALIVDRHKQREHVRGRWEQPMVKDHIVNRARFHWSILFRRFYEISHFAKNRILRKFAFCENSHAKNRISRIFAFRKNSHAKIRISRKFAFRENSHFAKIRIRKFAFSRKFACENSHFAKNRILRKFAKFRIASQKYFDFFRIRIASHFYFQCEGTSLPSPQAYPNSPVFAHCSTYSDLGKLAVIHDWKQLISSACAALKTKF
jgi:hypothetical protein